jgi:hypothetical protein
MGQMHPLVGLTVWHWAILMAIVLLLLSRPWTR